MISRNCIYLQYLKIQLISAEKAEDNLRTNLNYPKNNTIVLSTHENRTSIANTFLKKV